MKHILYILFFISFCMTAQLNANQVYIIVHGTWAQDATWTKPGGDFYEGLKKYCKESDEIVSFGWSGKNSFPARAHAAKELTKLIVDYPKDTTIIIIGHSHGGNVAIKASQTLEYYNDSPKIHILYTLGTPISSNYEPNMNKIEFLYNLFSFEDLVQPVIGGCKREFEKQQRIANLSVVVNDKEPDHSGIHCTEIAEWITCLHYYLQHTSHHQKSLYLQPGRLHFYTDKPPQYKIDYQHQKRVERDIELLKLCVFSLFPPIPEWRSAINPA